MKFDETCSECIDLKCRIRNGSDETCSVYEFLQRQNSNDLEQIWLVAYPVYVVLFNLSYGTTRWVDGSLKA